MVLPHYAKTLDDAKLVAHTNKILLVSKFKLRNNLWKVAGLSPQTHLSF